MDWRNIGLLWLALLPLVCAWSTTLTGGTGEATQKNEISPYIDIVLCPIREEPWSCARQQSARILDVWDAELRSQWQKLKVEADSQLNATLAKRGYSASEITIKEKPSSILKKIEIGSNFMKQYLVETMDGEEEPLISEADKAESLANKSQPDDENDDDTEADEDDDDEDENSNDNDNEDDAEHTDTKIDGIKTQTLAHDNNENGDEFIEIEEATAFGQLKKPGGGGIKKRKKGQASQVAAPATVLLLKPTEDHGVDEHAGNNIAFSTGHGHGHGGKPLKQKRKKRKKHQKPGESVATVVVEQEPSSNVLGLLDELVGSEDLLSGSSGGKRKKQKNPLNYGRSNGVTRGKKKKKRRAIMKLVLLGSFLKAKIELLLKILGAHLQIKFFAIALIGLLINIARFWIDVKRGGAPQKVVYVEHAHHQHHYEDHGDDWGEQGSYWKRSLQTDPSYDDNSPSSTDSYQVRPEYDSHYLAYRNQWQ